MLACTACALAACAGSDDYTVTFMVQNDDGVWQEIAGSPVEVIDGKVTLPPNPTKEYYEFRKWCTDPELTEDFKNDNIKENLTVYAYFVPAIVTVHLNGSVGEDSELKDLDALTAQYEAAALEQDLTFDGWFTNSACTEVYNSSIDATDLYGRYVALVSLFNGYETVGSQKVVVGGKAVKPEASNLSEQYPYMDEEDMSFLSPDGTLFDFEETTVTNNLTLTVQWKSPYLEYKKIDDYGNYTVSLDNNKLSDYAGNWPVISIPSQNVTVDDKGTKGTIKVAQLNYTTWLPNLKLMMFADGIEYIYGFTGSMTTSQVEEIRLPSTLKILEDAFGSHPNLKGVELPDGLEIIINSFWKNDVENKMDASVIKVGYDFEIAVPDSVINLSSVPTNLTFSENSTFRKIGSGEDTIIYKDSDEGKVLIAYYKIENGKLTLPDGYAGIQVGAFRDLPIKYFVFSADWSFVSYNERKNAVDDNFQTKYDFYTGGMLYEEGKIDSYGSSYSAAYTLIDYLDDVSYVILKNNFPNGVTPYVFSDVVNAVVRPYTYKDYADKVVIAPEVEEGGSVTVTVTAYNALDRTTATYTFTAVSGQSLTETDIILAISNGDVALESCTQFGENYDYDIVTCNQYLEVTYSIAVAGFTYEERNNEIVVTGLDASTALFVTGKGFIVTIPDEVDGKPVTSIAAQAFKGEQSLYMVYVGASVKSIGDEAFMNTPYLTGFFVTAGGLESIGRSAFENAGCAYDEENKTYVINQELTMQFPLANLKTIEPYAFKTKAIYWFTPVEGEEDRYFSGMDVVKGYYVQDLQVGEFYYDYYIYGVGRSGQFGYLAILQYTGSEQSRMLDSSGVTLEEGELYTVYNVDFVALAGGYGYIYSGALEFGRSFIGYNSSYPVEWVASYRIKEGSVYFLDGVCFPRGVRFGIVSYVEENAFTDCDYTKIKWVYHKKTGEDYWFAAEWLKTLDASIFAEGWFNGIMYDDEEYEELLSYTEKCTYSSATLMGWPN